MKKLLFFLAFIPFLTHAQQDALIRYDTDLALGEGGRNQLRINYNPPTKGTQYLYNEWKEGYLIVNDTVMSPQERLQVDLLTGNLIIGSSDEKGFIVEDKRVTGFAINKEDNKTKHFYVRLEPSSFENKERKSRFYEIISNVVSTNYLIKEEQKYIFDPNLSKGYQTQNSFPKEWKIRSNYFIKNKNNIYVETKLNKKQILAILDDKSSELKSYAKAKKLSFSDEYDVVKLLEYYHSSI